MKKCKECGSKFEPFNSFDKTCSNIECKMTHAKKILTKIRSRKEKESKKAIREKRKSDKEKIKSNSEWLKELQVIVNKYIRLKDSADGCISCDKPASWSGQWHCSHYISRGHSSFLRFNLWNMHKSCSVCNNHLSGNISGYTPRIIEKIGLVKYEWIIENKSRIARYDVEYIKRAIKIAKKGVKRLESRL